MTAAANLEPVHHNGNGSAARSRRARERRRTGACLVSVELGAATIGDLVQLGWLAAADRQDREAITRAFCAYVGATMSDSNRPRGPIVRGNA